MNLELGCGTIGSTMSDTSLAAFRVAESAVWRRVAGTLAANCLRVEFSEGWDWCDRACVNDVERSCSYCVDGFPEISSKSQSAQRVRQRRHAKGGLLRGCRRMPRQTV